MKRQHSQNTVPSAPDSDSSGIDAFLKRLDDVQLKKPEKPPPQEVTDKDSSSPTTSPAQGSTSPQRIIVKLLLTLLVGAVLFDAIKSPADERIFTSIPIHDLIHVFLFWVKEHPGTGAAAFILVYASCTVLLLPGTPLTLGGGYVYKVTYGWVWGIVAGTIISTAGSLLGSCSCFLLGRYIMRDRVRKWGRKYPLFDAIDLGELIIFE